MTTFNLTATDVASGTDAAARGAGLRQVSEDAAGFDVAVSAGVVTPTISPLLQIFLKTLTSRSTLAVPAIQTFASTTVDLARPTGDGAVILNPSNNFAFSKSSSDAEYDLFHCESDGSAVVQLTARTETLGT